MFSSRASTNNRKVIDEESMTYKNPDNDFLKLICMVISGYAALFIMVLSMVGYISAIDGIDNNILEMYKQRTTCEYLFMFSLFILISISIAFREEGGSWAAVPTVLSSTSTIGIIVIVNIKNCGVLCREYLEGKENISDKAIMSLIPYLQIIIVSCAIITYLVIITNLMNNENDKNNGIICNIFIAMFMTIMYMYMCVFVIFIILLSIVGEADISTLNSNEESKSYKTML